MFRTKCIAVLVLILVGLAMLPSAAQGQSVVYYTHPITWHPESIHYHRVYQGRFWNWSPSFGWYAQDRYTDVPHRVPGFYSYSVEPYWVGSTVVTTAQR